MNHRDTKAQSLMDTLPITHETNLAAGLTPIAGGRKAEFRRQYRSFSVSLCLGGKNQFPLRPSPEAEITSQWPL